MLKRIIIFFKVYWIQLLVATLTIALLVGGCLYGIYIAQSFDTLENFSKRQMAGQMALYLPMMFFVQLLILPLYFAMYFYMMNGGGMGKVASHRVDKQNEVKWSDIIGMEEAKRDAWEIVKLLKDRAMAKAIGGNIIKGMLLVGPPGCGKTYIAKAIATECGLPMISAVGSEFVAMFMGQGAARMKSLFKQARNVASVNGGCIIFIDEIDAFARPRDDRMGVQPTNISHNATINQFLTEMDGLRQKENNIVIIAATNVEEEELDPAIMRSGRFDRKIRVEKPTAREREALIKFYFSRIEVDGTIDIPKLAEKAKWFSPSDINNLVKEAAILALRENRKKVQEKDLYEALRRIMISIEKIGGEDKILSEKINVKWDTVIGMESAKKEAWEVVELMRDRSKLKAVGGSIVKGIIMFGPPGCGKTYLAKAMATESGFPFIARSGSEFVGMYIGTGTQRMKLLFEEARKVAKAEGGCIIFLDEIDSFAYPRFHAEDHGGSQSHNATVNQFLTEIDGLRQEENNIFVIGATNVSEDKLDSAVLRAGRLERKIYVTLPNLKEREDIFRFYLSKISAAPDVDAKRLAQKTLYYSPSQIESMVREAGLFALREKREQITMKDLSNAYDRITYGDKSNITMTEKEKLWTAYHEAGHALVAYLEHPTSDVIKATIIPRKGSLGMIAQRPVEELHSSNQDHLLASIKVALAGYAAEQLIFGHTSSGVGGDFDSAMRTAHTMVYRLGMGKSGLLGDFYSNRDHSGHPIISEKMRETLDQDVQYIFQSCMKHVKEILTEKKDLLKYFTDQLLAKQELEYDEIVAIFDKHGLNSAARPKA